MATQDKFLRGTLGNLVYYELNGRQIVRTKAKKVNMAAVSIARAVNFGHASRLSSIFTNEFKRLLTLPPVPFLHQRMSGTFANWFDTTPIDETQVQTSVPYVSSFRLNAKAEMHAALRQLLRVVNPPGDSLKLLIPEFNPIETLIVPSFTLSVKCSIALASCNLKELKLTQVFQTEFVIPYEDEQIPPAQINLAIKSSTGEITIVVASVLFIGKTFETREGKQDLKWRPVEVIGAMYQPE